MYISRPENRWIMKNAWSHLRWLNTSLRMIAKGISICVIHGCYPQG